MSFLAPAAFALLAALPVIVALHLLRLEQAPRTVPSLLLWRLARFEGRGNRLSRRIDQWLPLLLQLLAATLLTLALARPTVRRPATATGTVVLVLDVSASMAAREPDGRRIDRARDAALEVVRGLTPEARTALIAAGPPDRVLAPLGGDRHALVRALEEAEPVDLAGDPSSALEVAAGMRSASGATSSVDGPFTVHLFTDGAFALAHDRVAAAGLDLVVHPIGSALANAGIVTFEARRVPSSARDLEVLIEVAASGTEPRAVDVAIDLDGTLLDVRPLTVAAGSVEGRVLHGLPLASGVLTARLRPAAGATAAADTLPADDVAHLVLADEAVKHVTLVGEPSPALTRALTADPTVSLTRLPPQGSVPGAFRGVAVLSRTLPDPLPAGNLLVVEPPSRGPRARVTPGETTWDRFHPVTRLVDLTGLSTRTVGWPRVPSGLAVLAEVGGHPVILAGRHPGGRIVVLDLVLDETNLPHRAAFPILVAAALDWLSDEAASAHRHAVAAGEPLAVSWPVAPARAEVSPPGSDRWQDMRLVGRHAVFEGTDRAGLYRVRWPGGATLVAVNVTSRVESDLTPRWTPPAPVATTVAERGEREAELALPIAAVAAIVLAGEWWRYRRREAW